MDYEVGHFLVSFSKNVRCGEKYDNYNKYAKNMHYFIEKHNEINKI